MKNENNETKNKMKLFTLAELKTILNEAQIEFCVEQDDMVETDVLVLDDVSISIHLSGFHYFVHGVSHTGHVHFASQGQSLLEDIAAMRALITYNEFNERDPRFPLTTKEQIEQALTQGGIFFSVERWDEGDQNRPASCTIVLLNSYRKISLQLVGEKYYMMKGDVVRQRSASNVPTLIAELKGLRSM